MKRMGMISSMAIIAISLLIRALLFGSPMPGPMPPPPKPPGPGAWPYTAATHKMITDPRTAFFITHPLEIRIPGIYVDYTTPSRINQHRREPTGMFRKMEKNLTD
jgi:hypothetical protein